MRKTGSAHKRKSRRRLWFWIAAGGVLMVLLAAGLAFHNHLRAGMPSVEQLENFEPQLSTKLLDRRGEIIKEIYTQRRSYVPLAETPPWVAQAFLAIEDHRFYEHWGMRPLALLGAAAKSVVRLDFHFRGASTITQQLARNLYYTTQRTLVRKLREGLTAIEIERYYAKDEILEMYLTQTYFGAGAYGIAAAAATYFSKSVPELTVEEGALLAAIPKSPTRYNPLTNPENALARRNIVLQRMREVGFLSAAMHDSVRARGMNLRPSTQDGSRSVAPYFTETVRQQLNGIGRTFGFDPYRDGITVHTTLDARLQACAEQAADSVLPELQRRVRGVFREIKLADVLKKVYPDSSVKSHRRMAGDMALVDSLAYIHMPVQVALAALDPTTGHILAMLGGRDFEESKFNRAVQAVRQPGSAFKPFVYAAAIDGGIPITTRVSNDSLFLEKDGEWILWPRNYDDDYGGTVDLREGLYRSLNVVAVRMIREYTSPKDVAALAHSFGITTRLDPYDALALGSSGVIPLDLAAAYQVFQSGGILSKPMYITEIDDQFGQIISQYRPVRKAVLSEESAFLVQTLLRSVVDKGTGAALRSVYGYRKPAAGKTGTTNDYSDAWFVGFTPQLVTAVWVGLDDPGIALGKNMQGAAAALPIWARFIRAAVDTLQLPDEEFPVPRGIVTADICEETDLAASPYCPRIRTEYFNRNAPPPEPCTLHSGFKNTRKQRPRLF